MGISRVFNQRCRRAAVLCVLAMAATHAMAETTLDRIRQTGVIKVAFRSSAIPFSYLLPGQKVPVGYAIDICNHVVQSLRKELKLPKLDVQYVQADGKERFDAIHQNRADMECGNTTNSRERREKLGFAFSIPYYITGTRLLVNADSGIRDTYGLRNKAVAVAKGATGTAQLRAEDRNRSLNLRYVEIDTRAQAFDLLEHGKIDAFVQDDTVLYSVRSTAKEPKKYAVVGNFLTIEPLAIMFRGTDTDLKRYADAAMTALIEKGEFKTIYSQWFERPIPPANVNLDIPMNFLMRDLNRFPSDKLTMYPE